jgi:hypothetical protein
LTNTKVGVLAIDPQNPVVLYAGTEAGAFKSTTAGGSWTAMNTDPAELYVLALAVDPLVPSNVYLGTAGSGVFKSVDGGLNWQPLNEGLAHPYIYTLAIDPRTPGTVYAGTSGGGVYAIQQTRPTLSLNFATGSPGSYLTVTGRDFPAGSTASIMVNGNLVGTLEVGADGGFVFRLETAEAEEGHYVVTVTVNPKASVSFALAADQPLRPLMGSGPIFAVPAGIAFDHVVNLPLILRSE